MRLVLFTNNFARRNFIFLVMGIVIIFSSFLYVGLGLQDLDENSEHNHEMVNQVIRVLGIASVAPTYDLPHLLATMNNDFVHTSIDAEPKKGAEKIDVFSAKDIRKLMKSHANRVKLSYALSGDDLWLNVTTSKLGDAAILWVSFYFLAVLLAVMLLVLCLWVVNRMALPLAFFSAAAKRFEEDINAPALPEIGSGKILETIQVFNSMQNKIKRLVGDRMLLLAAISHDLRTPITRLRLRAESFADQDEKQYAKISKDLDELEGMVNGVLRFARDDSKQEAKAMLDINALLETLCNDMIDSGFVVEYKGLEQKTPFFGRVNGLRRAFTNLVDNAIKYGKEANVLVRKEEDNLIVEIKDKGPGIPDADLDKVFDPFFRAEKSRSRETGGVGLGLTVTHDIIQDHDGVINLVNLPDGGLKVTVTMPIKS